MQVLSLGPKFCHVSSKTNELYTKVQFENLMSQTPDLSPTSEKDLDQFKASILDSCYKYIRTQPSHRYLLTKEHRRQLKQLQENKDVILVRPDKGSGIVVMNRSDYNEKLTNILSDKTKFFESPNQKDTTERTENLLTKLLKRMKEDSVITQEVYEQIRPCSSTIPRLYGLPKVHKENVPLRPVIEMVNSPYHQIAKWLADILEPVKRHMTRYSLKDTFDFIDSVKDVNVYEGQMISLDVASLFTSIPLTETICFICNYIETNNVEVPLPINYLKELLLRCTFIIQFKFNEQFYVQKDGVAMGSPLGPLLADCFMASLENNILDPLISKLHLYKRYVGDTFIICDEKCDLDSLLKTFNVAHPSIRFTLERESNKAFPFLDVLLIRRDDCTIQRSIYPNPTWTGQFIDFQSFVPLTRKRNGEVKLLGVERY
uniref:Reverse transcriptase domain-containing protein n=1 Tax=Trichobilharzia regenti TaxID=157069 RepID=A0AA85IV23_TRIRE|nr:unnamed protein product [Trichobilharzia regenti]